jgi:hypothetical protein
MNQHQRNNRFARLFTYLTIVAVTLVIGTVLGCALLLFTGNLFIATSGAFLVGLTGFPIFSILIDDSVLSQYNQESSEENKDGRY